MERIRNAIFLAFGIKEASPKDQVDSIKKSSFPTLSFTKAEKEAWIDAGMPEIGKFLIEYRKENGN